MTVAYLLWFDTGASTGMCVLGIRSQWLEGSGDPGFEGLGRAIAHRWVAQVGREGKEWSVDRARAARGHVVDGAVYLDKRRAKAGSATLDYRRAEILNVTSECEALLIQWPQAPWGHEQFTLEPGIGRVTADTLSPAEVYSGVAALELTYGETSRVPFTQSASFAKTTVDDDKLKAAGCYYRGMGHANDAMRHALLFMREARRDRSGKRRAQAWPRIFAAKGK